MDLEHPIFNLKHPASGSMMFLQLKRQQNKMVVDQCKWVSGNVASLSDVRRALALAQQRITTQNG